MREWRRAVAVGACVAVPMWLVPASAAPAGAAVTLNRCVSSDHGLPVVTALSISPSAVDVRAGAGSVQVSLSATDTGGPGPATGVQAVSFQLFAPPGGALLGTDTVALRPDADGTWRGGVTIPPGVEPGRWRPIVLVRDAAGGVRLLDPDQLATAGLSTGIEVVSTPDHDPPRLAALTLSHDRVDTRARRHRVTVTTRISDDATTVTGAFVLAQHEGTTSQTRLHPVVGAADVWTGTLVVPRWAGRRVTMLLTAFAFDDAGNRSWSTPDALRAAGLPWRIRVRSTLDRAAPRARLLRLRPAGLDVTTRPRRLHLVVRVRDAVSGVVQVAPTLQLDHGPALDIAVHRASGTRRDGIWRGSVMVPPCVVAGTWSLWLRSTDRAGRVGTQRKREAVVIRAGDHLPPTASPVQVDSRQPTFRFTEDVVGISTTSAYLVTSGSPHTRIEGSWTCADRHGVAVDCAAGPVRLATYQVIGPVGPVDLVLNPEHVLDVMDLAGNPAYNPRGSG